jgi:hypothetical protein
MVRVHSALFALLALAACSTRALSRPQPAARVTQPADVCRVTGDGGLRCSIAGASERVVPIPFPVQAAAVRAAGGAYALGDQGELVRIAAHGRITGAFETELVSLVATRDHICGVDVRGGVLCARDHHHDRSCPGVAMPAWRSVRITRDPVTRLRIDPRSGLLCAANASGAERCADLRATCDRICLSYPACAPLRCLDPCAGFEGG